MYTIALVGTSLRVDAIAAAVDNATVVVAAAAVDCIASIAMQCNMLPMNMTLFLPLSKNVMNGWYVQMFNNSPPNTLASKTSRRRTWSFVTNSTIMIDASCVMNSDRRNAKWSADRPSNKMP